MTREKIEYVKDIPLFSSLTDDELLKVNEMVQLKTFGKNEIILYEEDTTEYMYIVIYGKVKVFQTSEDGKETILAIHSTGEFFGEMALLDGSTEPATVIAKEKSLVGLISKNEFYELLYTQQKIFNKIIHMLCSRLRESWRKIQILNTKQAHQRIKLLFIMLSHDHGKKSKDGIEISIKLTHQDIADMAGLTRESVTRVIDKWKKADYITILKNKYIFLPNSFIEGDSAELP